MASSTGTSSATLLQGNLGYDYYQQIRSPTIISRGVPKTPSLAIGAAIIWLVLGVGQRRVRRDAAAIVRSTGPSRRSRCSSTRCRRSCSGCCSLLLPVLPADDPRASGSSRRRATSPFTQSPAAWAQHLILPWITLALVTAGGLHPAHTHLDAGGDRRGLPPHGALEGAQGAADRLPARAAQRLTPVVTQFGIDVGALIGGAVVTETGLRAAGPRLHGRARDRRSRICR